MLAVDFETPTAHVFNDVPIGGFEAVEARTSDQYGVVAVDGQPWGANVGHVRVGPGDFWPGNNTARCLYRQPKDEDPAPLAPGLDYRYAFRLRFPAYVLDDLLLFETHSPREVYSLPKGGVTPHAFHVRSGRLCARLAAGDLTGTGWPVWRPNVDLGAQPLDTWADVIFRVRCSEGDDGLVEWYVDPTGSATFDEAKPTWAFQGPTAQFSSKYGVHGASYYVEMGAYYGVAGQNPSQVNELQVSGFRRVPSAEGFDAAVALFHPDPCAGLRAELASAQAQLEQANAALEALRAAAGSASDTLRQALG